MADWPEVFDREQGFSEADWRRSLAGAVRGAPLVLGDGCADITLDAGTLRITWTVLPPRRIALITLPRLAVHFAFSGVAAPGRAAFMAYFDRFMQRGGG